MPGQFKLCVIIAWLTISTSLINCGVMTNNHDISVVPAEDRIIVCYYGSWATYRPGNGKFDVEDIDTSLCTHVIYAFAMLDEATNTIVPADVWNDINLSAYERFVNLKDSNPNLKTIIAIGGWNEGSEKYSNMAASQSTRSTFVASVVNFLQTYKFDGLDLDWEYPTQRGGIPEDKENFALLITELREEFDKHGWELTAAIGVGETVIDEAYDFSVMCRDLDYINLMMYDLHGSWDDVTGHHTSKYPHPNLGDIGYGLTTALDSLVAHGGCRGKMVLGMGTYGKTYTLEDESLTDIGSPTVGNGEPGPFTQEEGTLGYNEICLNTDFEVRIDEYTEAPWAYKGDQWYCYDDVDSIKSKCEWAVRQGLLGGMIWSIETDDFRGDCGSGSFPLLTQINVIIRSDLITTTTTDAHTTTWTTTVDPGTTTVPGTTTTFPGTTTVIPGTSTVSGTTSTVPATTTASVVPAKDRVVVCYYGSWATYRQGDGKFDVADIDANLCTHAIYAFAVLNENTNEIESADPWAETDPDNGLFAYQNFVNLKASNPNLKTTIAIGGWNEGSEKYSNMAATKETRTTFIQSVVSFLQKYEFDGLDIDWEYPTQRGGIPEDRENFGYLITELREEFNKYDWELTVAIGVAADVVEAAYDFTVMCQDLDYIHLMMYDLHGSWDGVTGHHTSMYSHPNLGDIANSLTESLDAIISFGGCPSKMVMGMGTYGKTYTLVDESLTDIGSPTSGNGEAGPYTREHGMLGYNEICLTDYQADIDNYTMAPWAYKDDQWVCYDDVDSIETKCNWALSRGLVGGMIWSIETDDFRGKCGQKYPLLTKIFEIMKTDEQIATKDTTVPETTTTDDASHLSISYSFVIALNLIVIMFSTL